MLRNASDADFTRRRSALASSRPGWRIFGFFLHFVYLSIMFILHEILRNPAAGDAPTSADTEGVFVTRNLDAKINEFPGLIVEHLYVTFGDFSCSDF